MHENRVLKKNYKCYHSLLWLTLAKIEKLYFLISGSLRLLTILILKYHKPLKVRNKK